MYRLIALRGKVALRVERCGGRQVDGAARRWATFASLNLALELSKLIRTNEDAGDQVGPVRKAETDRTSSCRASDDRTLPAGPSTLKRPTPWQPASGHA